MRFLVRDFMKAIVRKQYGPPDALQFTEVEKPTPKDNEVLIQLYAASVNPLDLFHIKGAPWNRRIPGLRTPKQPVIGCDIAGRVEAVGRDAKQVQSGDEVFGVTGFAGGGFAEYACAPEAKLAPKPPIYRLRTQQPCPSRQSPPFRLFVIRENSSQAKRFCCMAHPVV